VTLRSLSYIGLLCATACASSRAAPDVRSSAVAALTSDPVCGTPGTQSGTWARMLPHDHPALASMVPSAVVGRLLSVEGYPVHGLVQLRREPPDTATIGAATDSLGFFELRPVRPGRYRLRLRGLGYMEQEHRIYLVGGVADTLCVRMRAMPVGLAPVVTQPMRSQAPSSRQGRARRDDTLKLTGARVEVVRLYAGPHP
jgi:hypothetical protein